MKNIVKIALFLGSIFLASCGAKNDEGKSGLTEKKTKLEELKKQQAKQKKQEEAR